MNSELGLFRMITIGKITATYRIPKGSQQKSIEWITTGTGVVIGIVVLYRIEGVLPLLSII